MKNYTDIDIVNDINEIITFLSKRDITELSKKQLSEKFGISQVDLLIILGSSMPYIAEVGADAYNAGFAKEIMIVGGIGHSTKYLVHNVLQDERYKDIAVINKSEADILKQIISKYKHIEEDKIIIENKSTNCGSNAIEALNVLKASRKIPDNLLIIQDPTMQIRTHAAFLNAWAQERTLILSFSPFIPRLAALERGIEFLNKGIPGLWTIERFIDLIMGEIPRIRDDENGYGPNGKGFISHLDIPQNVLEAYQRLLFHYDEYNEIKLRK